MKITTIERGMTKGGDSENIFHYAFNGVKAGITKQI